MPDIDRRRHHDITLADVMDRLDDIAVGLYLLHGETHYLTHLEEHEMADLTALRAQVAENTTVEESAVTLLGELSTLIRDNATDPAALAQIAADLDASGSDLAAAVTANTPSAPDPTPTPDPEPTPDPTPTPDPEPTP